MTPRPRRLTALALVVWLGPVLEASSAEPVAMLRPSPAAAARARKTGRTTVRHEARVKPVNDDRAASVVTRRDLEERLPRSAPDALRFEPGVYVQQTAHGQGSPYVRGLTGQQTIMMFDGIRLNNSTFRQGPNQYFFTVDSRTVQKLEVLRGSASTRYGSDAMGGALLATPIDPSMQLGRRNWQAHPRGMFRSGTADGELGGRAQLDLGYKDKLGFFGGIGYRDVSLLRTGGPIYSPATGRPVKVPLFAADGVTQRGTGFKELTADARLVWQANDRLRLTVAYYDYRQFDAPRTDRCPPATAPQSECLTYDEQYRTLVYSALDLQGGPAFAETLRFTVNYQNQHERRRFDRGAESTYRIIGRDDVYTAGTGLALRTREWGPQKKLRFALSYGLDAYFDTIASKAWNVYTDVNITSALSRGQYLDNGRYLTSGVWANGHLKIHERLELRAGGRAAFVYANAPGDTASKSAAIDRRFGAAVGSGGAALKLSKSVRWLVNVDQGFRAPNMDDLTSRQQTGAGYQGENASLRPERSLSLETGIKVELPRIEFALFGFQTTIRDLIARAPFDASECPPGAGDTGCAGSRNVFRLANLEGRAVLRGLDGALRLLLPHGFATRFTLAYAWGDGPNPLPGVTPARLPLSRVPPLNGTVELSWRHAAGFYTAAALRWARLQSRLALSDLDDQRIPTGGTPGFAVVDLRAGYRWQPHLMVAAVLENLANAAYRYHGSSVNGPGRSFNLLVEFGF
ncbi:MAG: TonB-dependent receptor [Nannocystis sp.]|nr:TonB-dependent receptor [Nannocystis sp.]MBA3546163.1 TonB-dependent receptor [Nannocystis sp.]